MKEPIVIGIAGGTGSGKTTLVNKLKEVVGSEVVTLTHDFYYKANADKTFEERSKMNYDHPYAFDTDMLVEHIKALKAGQAIDHPIYDFMNHTRAKETVHVEPKKVIIVEGILIFEHKELRKMLDMKIFVDADADVRIIRRILRDVKERGRSMDSVIEQYLFTVKHMHEEFVEPSKKHADIIVPEGGYNKVAVSMIRDRIRMLLSR
jgi:uridine kinase